MMRCGIYGHSNIQYGRYGTRYGHSGGGCSAMSDTEYDNASDDADDDWLVESAVPSAPDRFRSQPVVHDRAFHSHERYSSGPGPPNRQLKQPVQALLKFHNNNSIDSESVCSGTFTIDLGTLQSIQNLRQPNSAVNQPDQFIGLHNKCRPRPHTSMCVSDPEPISYDRGDEYRVPYSYPDSRQLANERQSHFAAGRQFHEKIMEDPRNYPPAPGSHRNFGGETARYESFQSYRDYNDYDRNLYRYEPPSYNEVRDVYRRPALNRNNWADYEYGVDADVHHVREEGHRQLPILPTGGRIDERGQLARNVDDPALYRSSASGNGCSRSHFNGRYEDYGPQIKDRYEHVPTRDIPASQMTEVSPVQTEYNERQQWHSGRVSHSRSQTPSYHAFHTAENKDQVASRYESVSAGDDSEDRYLSSVSVPRHQEPKDQWQQTRFQVESNARPRSSSATRHETEPHVQTSVQSRWYTASDGGGKVAQFPASSFESQSYTSFQDETRVRPRSSSASRHDTEPHSQASVQSRQYTVRDGGDRVAQFPTSSFESQSYSRTSTDHRGDTRHGNRSFSIPAKGPDSSPSSRSSSRDRHPAYPDVPGFPQDVPDEHRSSEYRSCGVQDERRRTGQTDKQETHRRSVIREPKAKRPVSETGRREDRSRRVKFQSDPNLTHTDDSATTLQSSNDSGRSSEGKRTHTAGRVTSDGGQQSSDRRSQSTESLRSSHSQSRDQEGREYSEKRYSSQTSLLAQSRSASAERNRQTVPRTGSLEQVNRSDRTRFYLKDRARSRDSSGDRRRVLPRAPLVHRQSTDDHESSSVIRDVATEIARMTSSVKSLDSEPPDRPLLDSKSSTDRSRKMGGGSSSLTVTDNVSRLTMSASDLDSYSSTSSALRTRERLEDQKWKKTQMRQSGLSGKDATLLAQIQDDLQSEISRYTAELDAGTRPISRSVVCNKDPETSAAETGNIVNTALIDSQVLIDDDQMLPKFRANVDVSLFTSPSSTIDVSVNPLTQKVLVEAYTNPAEGPVRTLRQNITLPRFADEKNMEHSVNADGILEVEVPLLYHFPGAESVPTSGQDRARAFVYEVRDHPRDPTRQVVEIVVDCGHDFVLSDLHVDVEGDRLVVTGERSKSRRTSARSSLNEDVTDEDNKRHLIKQFTLPTRADVAGITSRHCDDGRLSILVPVRR